MSDVLKGLAGNLAYLTAWLLPSLLGVGVFAVGVFPSIQALPFIPSTQKVSATSLAAVLAGASVLLGFVLNTASTPLYRFLEGYSRLAPLKTWRRERMLRARRRLLARYQTERQQGTGYATNLALEAASTFPSADDEVTPTRLGNAIRAFETYAWRQYRMDSQTLWDPLWAVVPQQLRDEYDHARAAVDFCVASMAVLVVLSLVVLGVWVGAWWIGQGLALALVLIGTIGPLVALAVLYRLAVSGCLTWGIAHKGIVEVGRVPLASALGLRLPATLKEEREMWRLVSRFARESSPETDWEGARGFDRWRATAAPPPPSRRGRRIGSCLRHVLRGRRPRP
jgi:hypothetical protein